VSFRTQRSKIVSTAIFVKLQQTGERFVVNEGVFCFPPHLSTVLTLLYKIVNKVIQSDKHHLTLPIHKTMTTFTV